MKLEKMKNVEIKKNEMISIKGGTSITLMVEVSMYAEDEYSDCNGNGKLDDDERANAPITLQVGC